MNPNRKKVSRELVVNDRNAKTVVRVVIVQGDAALLAALSSAVWQDDSDDKDETFRA